MSDNRSQPANGLDIVPVMPGAASLGAFQAGAAAAVVAGREAMVAAGVDVRVPAIGGASAGATVALLMAHAIAQGLDPVELLRRAWVDEVDLDMLATGRSAPLGSERLRDGLARLMTDRAAVAGSATAAPHDVRLGIALTSLRGHKYRLSDLGGDAVGAVTYADWATVVYAAHQDPRQLVASGETSALDLVVASTANPVVFPPHRLNQTDALVDLSEPDADPRHGEDEWWFTDGGLVQSRPLQRTLDLVPETARTVHCVVIDPRSEGPSTGESWVGTSQATDWRRGLVRAMSIFPAQALSDELRRLNDENRVREALAQLASSLAIADEEAFEHWAESHGEADEIDDLHEALVAAAGLTSTRPVIADVIHPLLVAERHDVERLLAGEILGDFGGFLSRELRASDFALGYACARRWWQNVLGRYGRDEEKEEVERHLLAREPGEWRPAEKGEAGPGDVPLRSRLKLARVAARALRSLIRR